MKILQVNATPKNTFRGNYREDVYAHSTFSTYNECDLVRPYLRKVANLLPKDDVLYLVGCEDGLRLGYSKKRKYTPLSDVETESILRYTRPVPVTDSDEGKSAASELLKLLPSLLGSKHYQKLRKMITKASEN